MAEKSASAYNVAVRRSERLRQLREGQPPEVTSKYFASGQRAVRRHGIRKTSSEEWVECTFVWGASACSIPYITSLCISM